MNIDNIKPIPKYIMKLIEKRDKQYYKLPCGNTRCYAYLTRWNNELIKITVAVRHFQNELYVKQVAVHGIHSNNYYVKDMVFYYIGGYVISWYKEGIHKYPKPHCLGEWRECTKEYDYDYDPYAPVVNINYVMKIPEYKYSAAKDYNDVDIFKYLRCYERYPQAEYLIKLGLPHLADKRTILALLEKDREFRRWLINNQETFKSRYINASTIIASYKTGKSFNESSAFIRRKSKLYFDKDFTAIKKQFRGKLLERFFSYIDEQKISYRQYLDYLNACNDLQLDMSLNKNAFPHDFKKWHDIRIDQRASQEAAIDKRKRAELYNQFGLIAQKYLPLQEYRNTQFAVLIAQSPAELIYEGKILNHCVGKMGYDQKFAREETLIFFIRNADKLAKPFVTVEYSIKKKSVLQCYGYDDKTPKQKVLDFVNKEWLPFANSQLSTIKKSKKAA